MGQRNHHQTDGGTLSAKTRLPLRLAFATYNWGLHVGIQHNYIDCNDHLVRLFSRLGYSRHLPALYLKEYGAVNSMRLDITDEQHLRTVGSPFLPVLRRFLREQGLAARTAQVPESIVRAFDNYRPRPLRGEALPQPRQAGHQIKPLQIQQEIQQQETQQQDKKGT